MVLEEGERSGEPDELEHEFRVLAQDAHVHAVAGAVDCPGVEGDARTHPEAPARDGETLENPLEDAVDILSRVADEMMELGGIHDNRDPILSCRKRHHGDLSCVA